MGVFHYDSLAVHLYQTVENLPNIQQFARMRINALACRELRSIIAGFLCGDKPEPCLIRTFKRHTIVMISIFSVPGYLDVIGFVFLIISLFLIIFKYFFAALTAVEYLTLGLMAWYRTSASVQNMVSSSTIIVPYCKN